jgi:hypothetical protein
MNLATQNLLFELLKKRRDELNESVRILEKDVRFAQKALDESLAKYNAARAACDQARVSMNYVLSAIPCDIA